jgi:hypothetical protein
MPDTGQNAIPPPPEGYSLMSAPPVPTPAAGEDSNIPPPPSGYNLVAAPSSGFDFSSVGGQSVSNTTSPSFGGATISPRVPSLWDRVEAMIGGAAPSGSAIARATQQQGVTTPSDIAIARGEAKPQQGNIALIAPELAMTPTEQQEHPILTGFGQFTHGLTTPQSMMTILMSGGFGELAAAGKAGASADMMARAVKLAPQLASLGFSAQMIKGIYNQIPEFKNAWDTGNSGEILRLGTLALLSSAFAAHAAQHGITGETGAPATGMGRAVESMTGTFGKGVQQMAEPAAKFVPAALGAAAGAAGEAVSGAAGAAGEIAGRGAGKVKEAIMGKPVTAPELVGKVTQATGEDVAIAARALKSVDTSKAQTFSDLSKILDAKVRENTAAVDAALSKSTEVFKPADLEKSVPVEGGSDVVSSPVKEALNQLRDFYEKTNDTEGIAKIQGLQAKEESGLTVKEINDIARLHGRDLNAYNAADELASGLRKRAAENTRTDVKDIVRKLTPNEETRTLDKNTSDLITTRDMTDQMAEKVQKLQNKFEKAGLLQKVGSLLGKGVNLASGGMVKGLIKSITGIGETEGTTLNAIQVERNIPKSLKLLNKLIEMDPDAALKEVQKLESGAPLAVPIDLPAEREVMRQPQTTSQAAPTGGGGTLPLELKADLEKQAGRKLTDEEAIALDRGNLERDMAKAGPGEMAAIREQHRQTLEKVGRAVNPIPATAESGLGSKIDLETRKAKELPAPTPKKQNAAAGWIKPDGSFRDFHPEAATHKEDAEKGPFKSGTTVASLINKGWVRKAGQGAYEVSILTPETVDAVEKDLVQDSHDLRTGAEYGRPAETVDIDFSDRKSISIPFSKLEDSGFDLRKAGGKELQDAIQTKTRKKIDLETRRSDEVTKVRDQIEAAGYVFRGESSKGTSENRAFLYSPKDEPDNVKIVYQDWLAAPGPKARPQQEYKLPTQPAQPTPTERRSSGYMPGDELIHEWGHVTNAALENLGTEGIKSHLHPSLGPKTTAAATVVFHNVDFNDPESVARNSGRILSTVLGGAAANELHSGIPFEINQGIFGDISVLKKTFLEAGFSKDEIDGAIRYGLDRAKRNLTTPGISDILLQNAKVREAGLTETMHASPERTEGYAQEVRRIRNESKARTEQEAVQGFGERNVGGIGEERQQMVAGTESGISKGSPAAGLEARREVTGEESEHPTVTALKTKYGSSINPADMVKGEASFLHSDGTVTNIGSLDHPAAISSAEGRDLTGGGDVDRIEFINNTGSIRVRYRPTARAGREIVFSVPEKGVTSEQVDMMRQAVGKMGRNGNLLIEVARTGEEPSESVRSWPENKVKGFATPKDVEPMLREIGAHPEQKVDLAATRENWAQKAEEDAKTQGGGFTIDPRTGEAPISGYMVEAYPESRVMLDHDATAADIQKLYDDNKTLFNKHSELHVGGYGKELNISANVENRAAAEALAKKLDQISIWDVKKGEEIPTGGAGKTTEFPDYSLEQRMADLRGSKINLEVRREPAQKVKDTTVVTPMDSAVRAKKFFNWAPEDSQLIRRSVYDDKKKTLDITFQKNGRKYQYADVPEKIFDGLKSAESAGSYFNSQILDKYKHKEITEGKQ